MRIFAIVILILINFSCTSQKKSTGSKSEKEKQGIAKQHNEVDKDNDILNETKTLYIASYKKECEGAGKQTCYLIKENPEDDWVLFYNEIEGFEYEAGKIYTITVEIFPVENPPADGSVFEYKLVSIDRTDVPDYLLSGLYDIWGLVSLNGVKVDLKAQVSAPMIEINTREKAMVGSTGCNQFNSTFEYNMEDKSFSVFFPIAMTKRGCPENSIEPDFLNTIEMVNGYSIKGPALFLLVDGETVMEFHKVD
jgi:heat shock protein HslJ